MKPNPAAIGLILCIFFARPTFATPVAFVEGSPAAFTGADDPLVASAELKSVVVYRSGAELSHTADATLPAGNVELAIDRISNDIDLNSVQVQLPATVTLLGFTYVNNYLAVAPKTPRVRLLEDSLDRLTESLDKLGLAMTNNNDLLGLLKKNQELKGTATGMNVADLEKLMDYYKVKSGELTELQYQLKKKSALLSEAMDKIKTQIAEEETRNTKQAGRLLLRLAVINGGNCHLTISYVTRDASWTPSYELRVKDGKDSIGVIYKANINQTTGLDWKQVKMALSTSVPGAWSQAPELNPQVVGFKQAPAAMNDVVVMAYGTVAKRDDDDNEYQKSVRREASAPLQSLEGRVAGLAISNGLADYTSVDEQRLNTVYTIDLPYDLPSTGKDQTVTIRTMDVAAQFQYFAVPKVSSEVYLLADIPDWGKLNLLTGKANIVLNGTYVGLTTINPGSTQDTLHLTVGKDSRITVQRVKAADFSSEKFLNSKQDHKYTYDITVRNNKKDPVTLTVLDQVPVSTNKDLDVALGETDNATLNKDKGELKWTLPLKPGESHRVRFGYTLRYPKEQELTMR